MGEDGRARGFCHVEFESVSVAKDALKLNGQELDGRQVRLDLSASENSREFYSLNENPSIVVEPTIANSAEL